MIGGDCGRVKSHGKGILKLATSRVTKRFGRLLRVSKEFQSALVVMTQKPRLGPWPWSSPRAIPWEQSKTEVFLLLSSHKNNFSALDWINATSTSARTGMLSPENLCETAERNLYFDENFLEFRQISRERHFSTFFWVRGLSKDKVTTRVVMWLFGGEKSETSPESCDATSTLIPISILAPASLVFETIVMFSILQKWR